MLSAARPSGEPGSASVSMISKWFRPLPTIVTAPDGTSELTVWTRDGDTLEPWAVPDSGNAIAAALSADGAMLAAADTNGGLRLWNLDSGAGPVIVRSRQAAPLAGLVPLGLGFSPDGARLLYGFYHGVLLAAHEVFVGSSAPSALTTPSGPSKAPCSSRPSSGARSASPRPPRNSWRGWRTARGRRPTAARPL